MNYKNEMKSTKVTEDTLSFRKSFQMHFQINPKKWLFTTMVTIKYVNVKVKFIKLGFGKAKFICEL